MTRNGGYEAFEALDGSRLFFSRQRPVRGVWSVPAAGGEETFVVGDVRDGLWSVAADGIYFVKNALKGDIHVYRFVTGRVEPLAEIPGSPALWTGFSVRRDGRSVLWSQSVRQEDDIMMVEVPWR
jgi:hypothetical protein